MSKIKLNSNIIKFLSLFQTITRTNVKDCIELEDKLVFVVEENQISRAIGKNAENVRRIEKALNRKIKIVEFNSKATQFIRNLIYPYKANEIEEADGIVTIKPVDSQTRGRIIGRAASNLREYERIAKRYFKIEEIKVI